MPEHARTTWILVVALSAATGAEAQIYRCESPEGVVFADEPCGETAEIVEVEEPSSGVAGGPPPQVRDYLEERRTERAEAREARQRARPPAPAPAPVIQVEQPVAYPVFWPRRHRPPHHRPRPPARPDRPPVDPGPGVTLRPFGSEPDR